MYAIAKSSRMIGFAATTAMAAVLLSGCATKAAPTAELSAGKAELALAKGKHEQAIDHAEAAVLADPHNAAYRATLGSAYLDAGRFASAATAFDDAMTLGDSSARNALSLALALIGSGKGQEAVALLTEWEGSVAAADVGLAYSLAGQPERGIHIMSNAIRGGDNNAKIRQNLAYSYALAGRWREARLMAAQDVPAGEVGNRMEQWAVMAQPEAWQYRVATLLDVPASVRDGGQPAQLALSNNPSVQQLAAEASGFVEPVALPAPVVAANGELAPLDYTVAYASAAPVEVAPAASNADRFETAFAVPLSTPRAVAAVRQESSHFVSQPVVQNTPVRSGVIDTGSVKRAAVSRTAMRTVPAQQSDGTHLVQLGSFSSEAGAKRAWGIYVSRYPELADHDMVITQAVVRGKNYWRVSAGGFGKSTSQSMCGRVKSSGQGCFAYAEGRPLPGAIDTGTRMAMR